MRMNVDDSEEPSVIVPSTPDQGTDPRNIRSPCPVRRLSRVRVRSGLGDSVTPCTALCCRSVGACMCRRTTHSADDSAWPARTSCSVCTCHTYKTQSVTMTHQHDDGEKGVHTENYTARLFNYLIWWLRVRVRVMVRVWVMVTVRVVLWLG